MQVYIYNLLKTPKIKNLQYTITMVTEINNNISHDTVSASHMISVIQTCHGFSVDDIRRETGLSAVAIYGYLDGYEPKPNRKAKLHALYVDAPHRDMVEYLNLHDKKELSWAIAALKRKLYITYSDLSKILGASPPAYVRGWISQKVIPVAKHRKAIAERLIEHGITREDIELEKTLNATFKYDRRDKRANKQILYMKDRDGNVRDIIRRVKEETGVNFKEMCSAIDMPIGVWWHCTRNNPHTPNIARQKQLFGFLQKIYEEKGLRFPFYCKETE